MGDEEVDAVNHARHGWKLNRKKAKETEDWFKVFP
jgi:hypothetical protein